MLIQSQTVCQSLQNNQAVVRLKTDIKFTLKSAIFHSRTCEN